jgi:hypothetical protein
MSKKRMSTYESDVDNHILIVSSGAVAVMGDEARE